MNTKASEPRPARKPQCERRKPNEQGDKRRCLNDGVACWVKGSFGRQPMKLCNGCIQALRAIGWNVRYQIEGDNPPPLENPLEGKG